MREEKGVTLLELLVSITLLAIILIPVGSLFMLSFQTTGATEVQMSDRTIAVDFVELLKDTIRSENDTFEYAGETFYVCVDEECTYTKTFSVVDNMYDVKYTISFIDEYENVDTLEVSLIKIDLILTPYYTPQSSEREVHYSVVIARENNAEE